MENTVKYLKQNFRSFLAFFATYIVVACIFSLAGVGHISNIVRGVSWALVGWLAGTLPIATYVYIKRDRRKCDE